MKSSCRTAYANTAGTCGDTVASPLHFEPITQDVIPEIRRILENSSSMTCDYTLGGLYMWINYFHYRYCIYRDTLFITGVEENCLEKRAFSCPVGALSLPEAIGLLEDYCQEHGQEMRFSAVPADCLPCFMTYNPEFKVEELADWSDYVYRIEDFATLSGKKLAKKRNHVNRFKSDYSGAHLDKLTKDDVDELKECLADWENESESAAGGNESTRREELMGVIDVLDNLELYGFDGAVLRTGGPDDRIVAFTLGEKINDTLFVHIEKMDHSVNGAGESVAHMFAMMMRDKYPDLRLLNREEDCGDPGLRRAKESWQPAMLLRKYNVDK